MQQGLLALAVHRAARDLLAPQAQQAPELRARQGQAVLLAHLDHKALLVALDHLVQVVPKVRRVHLVLQVHQDHRVQQAVLDLPARVDQLEQV